MLSTKFKKKYLFVKTIWCAIRRNIPHIKKVLSWPNTDMRMPLGSDTNFIAHSRKPEVNPLAALCRNGSTQSWIWPKNVNLKSPFRKLWEERLCRRKENLKFSISICRYQERRIHRDFSSIKAYLSYRTTQLHCYRYLLRKSVSKVLGHFLLAQM